MTVYDPAGGFLASVPESYAAKQAARGHLLMTDGRYVVPARGLRPLTGAERRRQHLASLR